jgi:hypothetical protein
VSVSRKMTKKYLLDVAERAVATYLQTVIGLLLVADGLDIDKVTAIMVAGIPAALSVLKSALAGLYGNTDSASLHAKV